MLFLEYFDLRVSIIPPLLYIHIAIYYQGYIISRLDSVVKLHGQRRISTDVISQKKNKQTKEEEEEDIKQFCRSIADFLSTILYHATSDNYPCNTVMN